jgi:AhpD family alkylhydroperoxidase
MTAGNAGHDPRVTAAPEVLDALRVSCAATRAAVDPSLLELARSRIAILLGGVIEASARPWGPVSPAQVATISEWPTSDAFDERERAALALTEQFVIDVTGVLSGPLATAYGAVGDHLGGFVQALYLLDLGQRAAIVLGRFSGLTITSDEWAWPTTDVEIPEDPMVAIMGMLQATGRLQSLDPVLKELVRLRGARIHRCRRCQSVRSVAAIRAGADESLLGADAPELIVELDERTQAALALVDATFVGPPSIDDELLGRLAASFSAAELVEIVCYLVRNAANKIPVAFGADDAIVDEGFEYQIIDPTGETVSVDASVLISD